MAPPALGYIGQETSSVFGSTLWIYTPAWAAESDILLSSVFRVVLGTMVGNALSEALQLEYIDIHHTPNTCFNYAATARDTVELGVHLIRKIINKIQFIKLPKSHHNVTFIRFLIGL